jgi:hypothetical protein
VMEIRYEQLVSKFPAVVRAMADFLQLPWEPAMLAPADQGRVQRFISTPSYAQVAQPVHGKSVGRWQNYRRYLEPVLPAIQPYLTRWNYPA